MTDEALCSSDVTFDLYGIDVVWGRVGVGVPLDVASSCDRVSSEPTHVIGRCALEVAGTNSDDTDTDDVYAVWSMGKGLK